MKTKITVSFLLLFVNLIYSQVYNCDLLSNQMKTCDFALKNLNLIKNQTKSTAVIVSVDVNNQTSLLETISFYDGIKDPKGGIIKGSKISVCSELEDFIKQNNKFCPSSSFDSKYAGNSQLQFLLPLTENDLLLEIKKANEKYKKYSLQRSESRIKENSNFVLKTKTILLNDKPEVDLSKTIESNLKLYNSDIIKISEKYYMVFKILKTSELNTNRAVFYLQYKLFFIEGNRSYLISKRVAELIEDDFIEIFDVAKLSENNDLKDVANIFNSLYLNFEIRFNT